MVTGQPNTSTSAHPAPLSERFARVWTPRRTQLTGRAALLALVLAALMLALGYPLRNYMDQRAEIRALREQTVQQQERVQQLQREKARWQDPAYVAAQARERLHFTKPGERGYRVVNGDDQPSEPNEAGRLLPRDAQYQQSWYGRLVTSVVDASAQAPRTQPGLPDPGPIADTSSNASRRR